MTWPAQLSLTPQQIAAACHVPLANAEANWPLILSALKECGILSPMVEVGAAATIATETGTFQPVTERLADPTRQADLAATQARYYPYVGRGFVQLTWEHNYRAYGERLGVDLVGHPEDACNPKVAARIFAAYWKRMGLDKACVARDWTRVRKLVNGGLNGWPRFSGCIEALMKVVEP